MYTNDDDLQLSVSLDVVVICCLDSAKIKLILIHQQYDTFKDL